MGTFHECDVFLKGTVTEVKRPRSFLPFAWPEFIEG